MVETVGLDSLAHASDNIPQYQKKKKNLAPAAAAPAAPVIRSKHGTKHARQCSGQESERERV